MKGFNDNEYATIISLIDCVKSDDPIVKIIFEKIKQAEDCFKKHAKKQDEKQVEKQVEKKDEKQVEKQDEKKQLWMAAKNCRDLSACKNKKCGFKHPPNWNPEKI